MSLHCQQCEEEEEEDEEENIVQSNHMDNKHDHAVQQSQSVLLPLIQGLPTDFSPCPADKLSMSFFKILSWHILSLSLSLSLAGYS